MKELARYLTEKHAVRYTYVSQSLVWCHHLLQCSECQLKCHGRARSRLSLLWKSLFAGWEALGGNHVQDGLLKEEVKLRIVKRRQLNYVQMKGVQVNIDRNVIEALQTSDSGALKLVGTIERCQGIVYFKVLKGTRNVESTC